MTDDADIPAMHINVNRARAQQLVESLSNVLARIKDFSKSDRPVRLVAVSKLKPANDILALHNPPTSSVPGADHRHFGENYLQELLEKSKVLPRTINWHFIGQLQTNKCRPLAEQIPNLWCVESVDTAKKADALSKGREHVQKEDGSATIEPLRVFIQVNTSGEASKSGCEPSEALDLARHIQKNCPNLKLQGLMTIGAIARSKAAASGSENEDFTSLREVRDGVAEGLGLKSEGLELSMGMSEDFEDAIKQGSAEVRIGSTIFGDRPPKKEAKVVGDV